MPISSEPVRYEDLKSTQRMLDEIQAVVYSMVHLDTIQKTRNPAVTASKVLEMIERIRNEGPGEDGKNLLRKAV